VNPDHRPEVNKKEGLGGSGPDQRLAKGSANPSELSVPATDSERESGPVSRNEQEPPKAPLVPSVSFLSIPDLATPGVGGVDLQKSSKESWIQLKYKSASLGTLIPSESHPHFEDDYVCSVSKNKIGVSIKSKSSVIDPGDIAFFSLDENKLKFSWAKQSDEQKNLIETLRDSVLMIEDSAVGRHYVLLRDPGVNSDNKAISLISDHPIPRTDKRRVASYPWATNERALGKSHWDLFVSRWKITSWLEHNGKPILISSGERKASSEDIRDVIPGEVGLSIKADKNIVRVRFEFRASDRVSRDDQINNAIREWKNSKGDKVADGKSVSTKDNTSETNKEIEVRLREIEEGIRSELTKLVPMDRKTHIGRASLGEIREQIRSLKRNTESKSKEMTRLDKIQKEVQSLEEAKKNWEINLKEDCLRNKVVRSDLCVVISLRVNASTTLEVAKIGDFDNSQP
jgi:hypothetical protein